VGRFLFDRSLLRCLHASFGKLDGQPLRSNHLDFDPILRDVGHQAARFWAAERQPCKNVDRPDCALSGNCQSPADTKPTTSADASAPTPETKATRQTEHGAAVKRLGAKDRDRADCTFPAREPRPKNLGRAGAGRGLSSPRAAYGAPR
jgi:hypothetical protein